MIDNPRGGYRFLEGPPFLSFAAVAQPGFAIERAVFLDPQPDLDAGFARIQAYLQDRNRPVQAVCGLEFRQFLPEQAPRAVFDEFNRRHIERLARADMLVEGKVPVTRTNVVMDAGRPAARGGLHAFSYTVPVADRRGGPGFVLAAVPEVRFVDGKELVIAEGGTSEAALREKIDFILDTATARLAQIGASWDDATGVQLYSVADLKPYFAQMLKRMRAGGWRGVQWHHALPPVGPSIMEVDVRAVRAEFMID